MPTPQPTTPSEPVVHDLQSRTLAPFRNWHEWLTRWNAVKTTEEAIGLLHCGLGVRTQSFYHGEPEYAPADPLAFYFHLANGWSDHELLATTVERELGRADSSDAMARQPLARKAFDMLCQHFFKDAEKIDLRNRDENAWSEWVLSEKMLAILQTFFRVEKKYPQPHMAEYDDVVVRNLPKKPLRADFPHQERLAVNFLLKLAEALWRWEAKSTFWMNDEDKRAQKKENAAIDARINAAQLWMIEILCALHELGALREHMFHLTDAHVNKLTEIALRGRKFCESGLPDGMKATTLQDALYLGSREALFLLERDAKMKVHKHLEEIKKAGRKKMNAEQQLKRLGVQSK